MTKKEMFKIWRLSGYTGTQSDLSHHCFNLKGNRMTTLKEDEKVPKHWTTITLMAQMLFENGMDADQIVERLQYKKSETKKTKRQPM